ncbi:ribosomal protein L14-domain-containing protein [Lipomyces japonicus]|uniref:60S ribosomal protein eL14 n=1 Tax=Lipomyces japonicus TaxID=56871 RepID=UPI0034CFA489
MSEEQTVIKAAQWRLVEVGRVALVAKGPDAGKLVAIVEIIDHKRVLVDGPVTGVLRQSIPLAKLTLTPLVVDKLPRGAKAGSLTKKWAASSIDEKWAKSAWAQKIKSRETRRGLNDFERFQVLILKKQRRYAVKKAVAKARKSE